MKFYIIEVRDQAGEVMSIDAVTGLTEGGRKELEVIAEGTGQTVKIKGPFLFQDLPQSA